VKKCGVLCLEERKHSMPLHQETSAHSASEIAISLLVDVIIHEREADEDDNILAEPASGLGGWNGIDRKELESTI
jgi:hypothetical protein